MQLKDFISNALIEICLGISEAKTQIANGAIAPVTITARNGDIEESHKIEQINFELCVTIDNANNSQTKSGAKVGILQVISAEIGKNTDTTSKRSTINVNKISFSVPYLPQAIPAIPK